MDAHNKITLEAQCSSGNCSSLVTYKWNIFKIGHRKDKILNINELALSDVDNPVLTLKPNVLEEGGMYNIYLGLVQNGITSQKNYSIMINIAPKHGKLM